MDRLYALDALHEYRLAGNSSYLNDSALKKRKRSLETLFLFLTDPSDFVLLEENPESRFLEEARDSGLFRGNILLPGSILPTDRLITWGGIESVQSGKIQVDPDLFDVARNLNNKVHQAEWKLEKNVSPILPKILRSQEALEDILEEISFPIVLKARYGLAGRNHIVLKRQEEGWKLQDIPRKLQGFPLVLESWKNNREKDFSTLWDLQDGDMHFLGVTEMGIDTSGGFLSIQIPSKPSQEMLLAIEKSQSTLEEISSVWESSLNTPLAMDGFFYRDVDSTSRVCQPFSEINFRWSIGRILFEIRKKRNTQKSAGIFFLNQSKLQMQSPWELLQRIRKETPCFVCFLTPPFTPAGKPYGQVALYAEGLEELDLYLL